MKAKELKTWINVLSDDEDVVVGEDNKSIGVVEPKFIAGRKNHITIGNIPRHLRDPDWD